MNDDYWEINGKLAVAKNKTTLTSQKVEATKAMIRSSASLAMEDATYTFGTIFLFITLIRLVPFFRDLYYKAQSCHPGNYHVRYFVRKHINRLIIDARDLSVFIVLLILVMATVVSIPRLLKGLPGRMRSLRTANYFLCRPAFRLALDHSRLYYALMQL